MGSLRNPVGPLPSTIYWRRRSIAAVLIALLVAVTAWIVVAGNGGGKKHDDNSGGPGPATSTITPGPSGSGPAIGGGPGGSTSGGDGASGDDGGKNGDAAGGGSGGAGGKGGTAGSGAATTDGTDGTTDGTDGTGDATTGDTTGDTTAGATAGATPSGAAGGAGAGTGHQVPVGSSLPTCGPGSVRIGLDSAKVAYEPGEKPQFKLVATNTSATDCKVNLGPSAVVLTITDTGDDQVWSSKDCPKTGGAWFEAPAHATITRTVTWDRRHSTTKCGGATPPAVGPGTYLVEVRTSVGAVRQGQKSIRLDKD